VPSRRVALIGAAEGPPVCIADVLNPRFYICNMPPNGLIILTVTRGDLVSRIEYYGDGHHTMPTGDFAFARYNGPKPGPICEVRAA
jgi:hypothetical protein